MAQLSLCRGSVFSLSWLCFLSVVAPFFLSWLLFLSVVVSFTTNMLLNIILVVAPFTFDVATQVFSNRGSFFSWFPVKNGVVFLRFCASKVIFMFSS